MLLTGALETEKEAEVVRELVLALGRIGSPEAVQALTIDFPLVTVFAFASRKIENMIAIAPFLEPRFEFNFMLVENEPGYAARLREMAASNPRVIFRPPVPMPELPAVLQRLRSFVVVARLRNYDVYQESGRASRSAAIIRQAIWPARKYSVLPGPPSAASLIQQTGNSLSWRHCVCRRRRSGWRRPARTVAGPRRPTRSPPLRQRNGLPRPFTGRWLASS